MKRKTITEIEKIYFEQFGKGAINTYFDITVEEVFNLIERLKKANSDMGSILFNAINISFKVGFYRGYRCAMNHKKNGKKYIF